MHLVKAAYHDGREEQMWHLLLEISLSSRIDVCLRALRFMGSLPRVPGDVCFEVADNMAKKPSPDVRELLQKTLEKMAFRQPELRTAVFGRLYHYSREWDRAKTSSIVPAAQLAQSWKSCGLWDKVAMKVIADSGPGAAAEIHERLSFFGPLLHEVELRLRLDGLVQSGILKQDPSAVYRLARREDERWLRESVGHTEILRVHKDELVSLITLGNFDAVRTRMKKSKGLSFSRFLASYGLDGLRWKTRERLAARLSSYKSALLMGENAREHAERIMREFCERFGIQQEDRGVTTEFFWFSGRKLGVRNPKLAHLSFLFQKKELLTRADALRLQDWILKEDFARRIFIPVVLSTDKEFVGTCAGMGYDTVVLTEVDLIGLLFAADEERFLMTRILSRCDLESLTPYETVAPVRDMFFGRDGLIKEIVRSGKGYAIVATRRMGKTSLLYRVMDEFHKSNRYLTVFLECGGVTDGSQLIDRVNSVLRLKEGQVAREKFAALLAAKQSECDKELVFFLDEIDDLIANSSEAEKVLQVFKSLAFEGKLRLFTAGFSELFARYRNYKSLFFNFLVFRRLGNLDWQSGYDLVAQPLEELGLAFEDREVVVSSILEITSLHPNQIQIFCDLLVKHMASRRRRSILISDVEEIARHPEFEDGIVRIMNSNLIFVLEKLIISLAVYYEMHAITAEAVLEVLRDWEIQVPLDRVIEILEKLVLYAVLEEREQRYEFAHPYFAAILRKRDVQSLIELYADEVLEQHKRGVESSGETLHAF